MGRETDTQCSDTWLTPGVAGTSAEPRSSTGIPDNPECQENAHNHAWGRFPLVDRSGSWVFSCSNRCHSQSNRQSEHEQRIQPECDDRAKMQQLVDRTQTSTPRHRRPVTVRIGHGGLHRIRDGSKAKRKRALSPKTPVHLARASSDHARRSLFSDGSDSSGNPGTGSMPVSDHTGTTTACDLKVEDQCSRRTHAVTRLAPVVQRDSAAIPPRPTKSDCHRSRKPCAGR